LVLPDRRVISEEEYQQQIKEKKQMSLSEAKYPLSFIRTYQ